MNKVPKVERQRRYRDRHQCVNERRQGGNFHVAAGQQSLRLLDSHQAERLPPEIGREPLQAYAAFFFI
jgi:hypothetical protein